MAKVRNLKYGIGNAPQAIVEQPIFKGTPLKKWVHNGIVVWENGGANLIGMCAKYNSGVVAIDWSGEDVRVKVISGANHFMSNKFMAIRISQGRAFQASKDFVNWKYIYTEKSMYAWWVTDYGIFYISSDNYDLYHITIEPDTLEVIADVIVWSKADGFVYSKCVGRHGNEGLGSNTIGSFWYGLETLKNEYDVHNYVCGTTTDEQGRVYVDRVKEDGGSARKFKPYYGTQGDDSSTFSDGSCMITRRMFEYGGTTYIQPVQVSKSEARVMEFTNMTSFGSWLDDRTEKRGGTAEERRKYRAELKDYITSEYPLTMENEDVSFMAYNSIFEFPRGNIGDKLLVFYGEEGSKGEWAQDYTYTRFSGFLGVEETATGLKRRKYIDFPWYEYYQPSNAIVRYTGIAHIHDGQNPSTTTGNNFSVNQYPKYTTYCYKYDDDFIAHDEREQRELFPYYVLPVYSYYVAFRHRKDISKSFFLNVQTLLSKDWVKLDIPKEWFS
ncbi:MAG: hypothetical protein KBT03_04435 [Bacteroidales bacterium]|nr:hypothetical protein [Candidatus Scybalousia scybalohippi]